MKTVVYSGPNLGLLTVAVMDAFRKLSFSVTSLGAKSIFAEFHQSDKPPGSATAHDLAEMFGVPKEKVGSGRSDPLAEVFLDVPIEHLRGFARIGGVIKACGSTFKFQLDTDGRKAYFYGLMAVIAKHYERGAAVGRGVHLVSEHMFGGMP